MSTFKHNERSWAIQIISEINSYVSKHNMLIHRAGGESTLNDQKTVMFPDVILYGDNELSQILQGWELKMPDVPIDDEAFVSDAQRKARCIGLSSCLIWNFTYAKLFVLNEQTQQFEEKRVWSNSQIKTRADVTTYKEQWLRTLYEVIDTVNEYLHSGKFKIQNLSDTLANNVISNLINEHKGLVAENYKNAAHKNSRIGALIDAWWLEISAEYKSDEEDKYCAYAKTILLQWINKIIFAHLIKSKQAAAYAVEEINEQTTPQEANEIFAGITEKCDFYNIFSKLEYDDNLPELTWCALVELSLFIKNAKVNEVNQSLLQTILEGTINTGKREINGQFTTPLFLAKLLAQFTVIDWSGLVADPCCGTGTIPRVVIDFKKNKFDIKSAIETTWAGDKYSLPLQIANISMASSESIYLANKLIKHNALTWQAGEPVYIVNPVTGDKETYTLPKFNAIISNLPFVECSSIPDEDKIIMVQRNEIYHLDKRADLCHHIALHLADVLEDEGRMGILVSNAWLGTKAGENFYNALLQYFVLKAVHISSKGRWFQNAQVVTTILILEKRHSDVENQSRFFLWNKSLSELECNKNYARTLVDSAILEKELDPSVATIASYSEGDILRLKNLGISYNALFHHVSWLLDFSNILIPMNTMFRVFRGSRRGWDKLFYPSNSQKIEGKYLKDVIINSRQIDSLVVSPDNEQKAFCCSKSYEELKKEGSLGALKWIKQFENQVNGVGKKLKDVLKTNKLRWYELEPTEMAQFFTALNPDERLFYAKSKNPVFINQRLIGLNCRDGYTDIELYHALLNSLISKFYIEACGFGRGLGVLDLNKDTLEQVFILDPNMISSTDRLAIIRKFKKVVHKKILSIEESQFNQDVVDFEKTVLRAYGKEDYYEVILASLLSLRKQRKSAVDC